MNLYKNLNLRADQEKGIVHSIVEIPMGSMVKYEFNKELNVVEVDRFLTAPMPMPYNYGSMPQTYNADDKDPLDIIVLSQYAIQWGAICKAKVLWVLHMMDQWELDDKIIAVAHKDPLYHHMNDINDLFQHTLQQIEFFLWNYKKIEKKEIELKWFEWRDVALKLIAQCHADYETKKAEGSWAY